jgi:hypothetical protein
MANPFSQDVACAGPVSDLVQESGNRIGITALDLVVHLPSA